MTDFQAEKDLVRRYHADIAQAGPDTIAEVLGRMAKLNGLGV